MLCVLIGVLPPRTHYWDTLCHDAPFSDDVGIEWRDQSIADDEGTPTLLIEAICHSTTTTAEMVMAVVEGALNTREDTVVCEVWASAPAPLPLRPSDGYRACINATMTNISSSSPGKKSDMMHEWGFATQRKVLDELEVHQLNDYVRKAIEDAEANIRKNYPDIIIGKDNFIFREIASRSLERFDLLLPNDSDAGKLVTDRIVNNVIGRSGNASTFLQQSLGITEGCLLWEEIDYDISVVYSRPGASYQGWHADGDHMRGANDAGFEKDGYKTTLAKPYALCLFIPLLHLNEEVGYTQFWPGSHRNRSLLGFGKVAELIGATYNGICNAGDGLWYDYRLFHRGMPNNSNDTIRPVLQILFKKKWYAEKANYGDISIYEKKEPKK